MTLSRKSNRNRGFTLAELIFVVAIIAVLVGIAFIFVNPQDLSYVEYNRSAEAIATAAQNRLTEIRNAGDMSTLRSLGKQAIKTGETVSTSKNEDDAGGYRYVFNYTVNVDGMVTKNEENDLSYILPFGAIDTDLAKNYIVIGFQSDTGMVREVYYSPEPIGKGTVESILQYQNDEAKRKAENVGYYMGSVYDSEVAFANLPTPQLTITNYEELTLSIYLPEVKQLSDKKLGILISLSDKGGESYSAENNFSLVDTAIYSTFSLGDSTSTGILEGDPIIQPQNIETGKTYTLLLDTIKTVASTDMMKPLGTSTNTSTEMPKGVFEDWAKKSKSYDNELFKLGDNSVITVTVYCLYDTAVENYDEHFPIDPTFMPRSVSVTFNGWFNNYDNSTVEIACGRHLQNLGKLAQMRDVLTPYLPKLTIAGKEYVYGKDELPRLTDGQTYTYGDYNYGMASTYTAGSSHGDPVVEYEDVAEKYKYRSHVKSITKAKQVNAIDFNCDEWKENGKQIAFTPINLPDGFYYYGNYLTISHLYVDAPFYAGLFGYAYHYRLYDILLVNPSVKSRMPTHLAELYEMGVGALVGTSRDSSHINNCQVYMTQENGSYNSEKYRVVGECYVGGLIGFCEDENIENCSASVYTGYQKGAELSSQYVGGLLGCITGDSEIENCYAAGNLSGEYVGGLVGYIVEDSDPSGDDYRIETCYTAGHIEYAEKSAAGILGCIGGYGGNPKSSLNITGNYCVIIYGEKTGTTYQWNSTAPIYGTFEGDGFEWIQTHDFHYGDNYLKGKYAGFTYFAGASFESMNKNYYIAQQGIQYKNSPYFEAMEKTVQDFEKEIADASSKDDMLKEIGKASDKIFWLKKLQTLDKIKELMDRIIYEVEQETDYPGGFYQYTEKIWFDQDRARVEGEVEKDSDGTEHKGFYLTLVQALNVIYNGTYTDNEGKEQSVSMSYKGSNGDKKKLNEFTINGEKGVYTFMDYYNFLKEQYNTLLNDSSSEEQITKAKQNLDAILGNDDKEILKAEEKKDGDETYISYTYFYHEGLFYKHFCSDLLYRLFDKAKDYYQEDKKDKTGELVYRYFRDLVTENFYELICDLGMSSVEREKMLEKTKISNIEEAITALGDYSTITGKWTSGSGPMSAYASEAAGYASTAKGKLEELLKILKANYNKLLAVDAAGNEDKPYEDIDSKWYLVEDIQSLIKDAITPLSKLYDLLDEHKLPNGTKESEYSKYYDVIDTSGTKGDMRKLRDPVANFRNYATLCVATPNSGVENALRTLKVKLESTTNPSSDLKAMKDAFTTEVNTCLGSGWGYTDSGYCLKNATELRNAARGYVHGSETETRDHSLDFMYDYNNTANGNPYADGTYADHYVDGDNKIYNNVFPYEENGSNTKYYPFPFVYGLETEDKDILTTYILFHYGDWLTQDLWASDDPTIAALDIANAQMTVMYTELTAAQTAAGNGGSTGTIKNTLKSVVDAIQSCQNSLKNYSSKDNAAQKSLLKTIGTTISSWLGENGAFTKLVEECEKHDNKTISADVVEKIENYQNQLQDLVDQINALN